MMTVSRIGQPARRGTPVTGQKIPRWTESSTIDSSPKHPSTTSIKKSNGHSSRSTSGAALMSQPSSRNKCPTPLGAKSHSENLFVAAAAPAMPSQSDTHLALEKDRLGNFSSLPAWLSADPNDLAASRDELPLLSDSCSSSTQSDPECLRSTSSPARSNAAYQLRDTCRSFWEDCASSQGKHRHQRSSLSSLWGFKPEVAVEEVCDPILVSIHVLESAGPLRLVVDRNATVHNTIDVALSKYASQRRQPKLVDPSPFFGLYCRNPDFEALDGEARIGHRRARQFHLYHKQGKELEAIGTDATSLKSVPGAPIKTWCWDCLVGMGSWAASMAATFSKTLSFWAGCFNPWRFRPLIYILSVKLVTKY